MNWKFQKKDFTEIPEDCPHYGFIYLIKNLDKNSEHYLWEYVGKKALSFSVKKKISKKTKLATKTKKKTERVKKGSGWENYYGSSTLLKSEVLALGEDKFSREILHFCSSKTELSYKELEEQIKRKVLLKDSYNMWISARIYKSQLLKEKI